MNGPRLLPPGTLLAGKFRIERLLGSGAMGAVYAISHEITRHKRALKLLHPEARVVPDLVRRFLNEASAAGRAGNPHLVETFDAGTLPTGEPYVVMELLQGETLGEALARERVLRPGRAADIVAQAAEGIEAAHRAGIIHRDLKPDNLFLTNLEGRPFVKILDFGVSKFLATRLGESTGTRAGMVYGSPAYMSPEQIVGQLDIDARSDVYSLGVVLFQSLTGRLPFDAPNIQVLTARMLNEAPIPIESIRQDLSPALVYVVKRALATAREHRFATAWAMAEALKPSVRTRAGSADLDSPPAPAPRRVLSAAPSLPPGASNHPPGVPDPRRVLVPVVAGAAALAVAGTAALLLAYSKGPTAPVAAPMAAPPKTDLAPVPPTATLAQTSELPLLPAERPPHVDEPRRRSPPGTSAAPAPSGTLRPSNARNLGLSQENPFR
jgi:eukaryotic-like serine/threonine-protein kinase